MVARGETTPDSASGRGASYSRCCRHAGHADILREGIDGAIGYAPDNPNLPNRDAASWATYRERVEAAAREAAGLSEE